jgi:hypothetical protein
LLPWMPSSIESRNPACSTLSPRSCAGSTESDRHSEGEVLADSARPRS